LARAHVSEALHDHVHQFASLAVFADERVISWLIAGEADFANTNLRRMFAARNRFGWAEALTRCPDQR
jgi:hypothetical protein